MGFRAGCASDGAAADTPDSPGRLMIYLTLLVIIGAMLLFVAGLLLRDSFGNRGGRRRESDLLVLAGAAPARAEIPPQAVMDRIFADDDLTFVTSEGAPKIRKEFLRDRRRIAFSW